MRLLLIVLFSLAVCQPKLRAEERVLISEFLAANVNGLLDRDGDASDWLEVLNATAATVNLAGWHLTDDATDLAKWTFPATNLGPGRILLVFASAALQKNFLAYI